MPVKMIFRSGIALAAVLSAVANAGLWNTAYYAAWTQWQHMPADRVDFGAMTHVVHFALFPNTDGTLDSDINGVTASHSTDVVTRAHAAGTKALVSIGGAGSATGFRGACGRENLSKFINNIVTFARSRGYDGVDLDWEPLLAGDAVQFSTRNPKLNDGGLRCAVIFVF